VLLVPACGVCGERERTIVAEYNRLIFHDGVWHEDLARYDYALCHGCGLVYPTRRPDRAEYEHLYANFNEFLLREGNPNRLSVPELTPELAQEIDQQFLSWRELLDAKTKGQPIRRRLLAELEAAQAWVPQIAVHMSLAGAKVLHLRAKSSTFAAYVKDVHGVAQADVVTLFPAHRYLAEKNLGIRADASLDFEDFRIPFAERYDLIVENHIFVHMVDPSETFTVFRSHLRDEGAIFLRGELADDKLYWGGKNLFAELRPFHFHQFDMPTLKRMLRRFGFDPVGIHSAEGVELMGLARVSSAESSWPRIEPAELRDRIEMYRMWRDESILSLPRRRAAALFGAELPAVWTRVRGTGRLKTNESGLPLAYRKFGELRMSIDELEIGQAGRFGRSFSEWLTTLLRRAGITHRVAELLRGTKVAMLLASLFRGTRVGLWLRVRTTNV
jgi:hypothetical protein